MTRPSLQRLVSLPPAELAWRGRAAVDVAVHRARSWLRAPRWQRRDLAALLVRDPALSTVTSALDRGRWLDANESLARHFHRRSTRFVIAPRMRSRVTARVIQECPDSVAAAARRANRLLSGQYDILGYRGVAFNGSDWHRDPVHGKRPPVVFWSTVPYLDPACGDHKVIWELNRHQHWMVLGRAYWLTGDPRYRQACLHQLSTWLEQNPPLVGINWASALELGFRTLSWIWALHFFAEPDQPDSDPWIVDLLLGLDRQLGHVERHLSYYFSPNTHLLGEALALYVAGRTLPELSASPRREAVGRRVLVDEITNQIEPDGGHAERSTHYHRYTLDFYLFALAVARITDDPVAAVFERAVHRLASAARLLADDQGRLPHLGDDDGGALLPLAGRALDDVRDSLSMASVLTGDTSLGVGRPPEEVHWVLGHRRFGAGIAAAGRAPRALAPPSGLLANTGYCVSRNAAGDHIVVDAGPHGFLNGGHAHADALALTFTHRGRPLLIDPGTACYTIDPALRDRFRSTAFHNTLTLDGRSQSTPRGPFHWAQTACGSVRAWRSNPRFDYLDASHDGYRPVTHHRRVLSVHGDLLVVADCVTGDGTHTATVHWHVDPDWTLTAEPDGTRLTADGARVRLTAPLGSIEHLRGDEATGLGWHAPVYGRVEPAATVRITTHGPAPLWIVSVFDLAPGNPVRGVAQVPLEVAQAAAGSAAAFVITRARSVDTVFVGPPSPGGLAARHRFAGLATDAGMLLVRRDLGGVISALAMADGTCARTTRGPRFDLRCAEPAAHLHADGAAARPGRPSGGWVVDGSIPGARVSITAEAVPWPAAPGAVAAPVFAQREVT